MSKRVVIGPVRLTYANVLRPVENRLNGKVQYSTTVLVSKDDKDTLDKLKAAVQAALADKFGGKLPPKMNPTLRDGDTETKADGSPMPKEFSGHWFFSARSNEDRPPEAYSRTGERLAVGDLVSGDYAKLSLSAYAYDNAGNRGVAFGLNGVQLWEKGEALGGASVASEFGITPKPAAKQVLEDADVPW